MKKKGFCRNVWSRSTYKHKRPMKNHGLKNISQFDESTLEKIKTELELVVKCIKCFLGIDKRD